MLVRMKAENGKPREGLPIAGLIVPPRAVLALLLEQRREPMVAYCSDCGSVLTLRNLAPGCGLLCKDCDGGGKSR